jgi:hypothetical protein
MVPITTAMIPLCSRSGPAGTAEARGTVNLAMLDGDRVLDLVRRRTADPGGRGAAGALAAADGRTAG